MKGSAQLRLGGVSVCLLLIGAVTGGATVGAQASSTAAGTAYGVQVQGPVPLEATPTVEAAVSGSGQKTADESLIHVPAQPLAESFTARVQAGASGKGTLNARLQAIIETATRSVPTGWNGRGYAVVEDLVAGAETVQAQIIESESVAGCENAKVVYASGARVVGLTLAGTAVPIPNAEPNQTLIDQGGIKIVLWETNWDPQTGGTTDGEDTVWTNALHVTAPGGIDLTVSHSEARAECAPEVLPRGPGAPPIPDAPPAQAIENQPNFTG